MIPPFLPQFVASILPAHVIALLAEMGRDERWRIGAVQVTTYRG